MSPVSIDFPGVLLCLGISLAIFVLLRRYARQRRRQGDSDAYIVRVPPRGGDTPQSGDDPNSHFLRQQVELHETVRALSARVDNKIRILEHLTGVAQQQIARLESLLQRAEDERHVQETGKNEA